MSFELLEESWFAPRVQSLWELLAELVDLKQVPVDFLAYENLQVTLGDFLLEQAVELPMVVRPSAVGHVAVLAAVQQQELVQVEALRLAAASKPVVLLCQSLLGCPWNRFLHNLF